MKPRGGLRREMRHSMPLCVRAAEGGRSANPAPKGPAGAQGRQGRSAIGDGQPSGGNRRQRPPRIPPKAVGWRRRPGEPPGFEPALARYEPVKYLSSYDM